jgi:hypothetical protein
MNEKYRQKNKNEREIIIRIHNTKKSNNFLIIKNHHQILKKKLLDNIVNNSRILNGSRFSIIIDLPRRTDLKIY